MKNFTKKILPLIIFIISAFTGYTQAPKLNSLPSAASTMFLDFDGQTVNSYAWNNGNTLYCAASTMTAAQITEIFNRVSEDYRPFDINITTDSAKFLAAPVARRMRLIITPTSGWYTGVGGISYIGSFTWGDDTPGFIFTDRLANYPKYIAECCSHEGGHTVGLSHQSTYDSNCTLIDQYALGTGTGEIGWAPVMGNSYYKNMTGWNDGPTPYGCALTQDNLTIITTTNGFGYRADDFGETLDNNTFNLGIDNFSTTGVITTTTDNDAFKFTLTQTGTFHLDAKPYGINNTDEAANLDIKVLLYNSAKNLIGTFNPSDVLNIVKDTTLTAGSYYLVLSGTGNSNTSEYGSLGSYTLRGSAGILAIHDIALSGNVNNGKQNLSWKIIADEPAKTQTVEVSSNGRDFSTLANVAADAGSYSYAAFQNSTLYYRIKVISVIGQTAYSNVIALKVNGEKDNIFNVSTFIHNEITVNANENYQYILLDINGKIIGKGNGTKGMNRINMTNKPAGIYVIQLLNNNNKQTERIIRQ